MQGMRYSIGRKSQFLYTMDCKNDLFEYLVSKLFWLYVSIQDRELQDGRTELQPEFTALAWMRREIKMN